MKKIIFIVFILVAALAWFFLKDSKTLKIEESYTVVNENNKKIPATLYYRNVDVEVGSKMENVYEIVIVFDKELEMKINPVVIVPKYKLIGLVEGGEKGFIKFGNKVFQLSDKSNKFTMLDNAIFFDDPPIKKMHFDEKTIIFNSFEGLKKYGQIIMLKKK